MIRFKLTPGLVFLLSVSFLIYSCREEEAPLTAYGDVLIKSIQSGDSVLYGVYYYAYSWEKMNKATVNREGENTILTLDSIEGRYTFTHIPDSSEFISSKPIRANYIFNVDFDNGEHYETSDFLDSTSLTPAVFKECYFDTINERLRVEWEKNILADLYVVVLEKDNKEIVFQSGALSINQTDLWISSSSYGWIVNKQPGGGEKYCVIISAYQYEPIPSSFDLQSVSVSKSGIIEWIVNNDLN